MAEGYLMDLERTILNNRPYYWKSSRHGYTADIRQAGKWKIEVCQKIVERDINKDTILITEETIERILGKDALQLEGIRY